MRAIIEESTPEISQKMQELALMEGAFLKHLHVALFTDSRDVRMLTIRQLSRQLIALWVADNDAAVQLLARVLVRITLLLLSDDDDIPAARNARLLTVDRCCPCCRRGNADAEK